MADNLEYICDTRRHLICRPYSIANLHRMARELGIGKHWYHSGIDRTGARGIAQRGHAHYDIPERRIDEITAKCLVVSSRDLRKIIGGEE